MSGPFSAYDYIGIVLPGGAVISTAFYGWFGWPYPEPGATALVAILAAAFAAGTAIGGFGAWLSPIALGKHPGAKSDPLWGLFDGSDAEFDREQVHQRFEERLGQGKLVVLYHLGYVRLQHENKAGRLDAINQQLAFNRNMAAAVLACLALVVLYAVMGKSHLPLLPWVPVLVVGLVLFTYRFRRQWRWFGTYVVRGVLALPVERGGADPSSVRATADGPGLTLSPRQ